MRNKLREKVQFIHAEEMFSYYLINIWKKRNWLKKTLSHLSWLAHLHMFISKIFISPRIPVKSSDIPPTRAGSLLIWTHYTFIEVFLKKVRSHLAIPVHLSRPAHLYTNRLLFVNVSCEFSDILLDRAFEEHIRETASVFLSIIFSSFVIIS